MSKIGEMISLRQAFGEALVELGGKRRDFVLFDADVYGGTGTKPFVEKYPRRVLQFGTAEQNMMLAASGFTTIGLIPIVTTFAVWATMRAHEQFRTFICAPNLNVKVCVSHVGLDTGPDGLTAQALEDLATTRAIPNLTVLVPADAVEMRMATSAILDFKGPIYMRTGRSPTPVIFGETYKFKIGKANVIREGEDVTIIACGVMVARAKQAHEKLLKMGIRASLINMSTIKPVDKQVIIDFAKKTRAVVTCEDHNIIGGLGSAVSEVLTKFFPVPQEYVGVNDLFGESGDPNDLAKKYHLTAKDIVNKSLKVSKRKNEVKK